MPDRTALLQEIETLPAACLDELMNFVAWLKHREFAYKQVLQIPETMLLSEASLSKDWDTTEEDEAWADL